MSDINGRIYWAYQSTHAHGYYSNYTAITGCAISKDKNYIYSSINIGGSDANAKSGVIK